MAVSKVETAIFYMMHHTRNYFFISLISFWLSPSLIAQKNVVDLYYSGEHESVIRITSEAIASDDTSFNTYYLNALSEIELGQTQVAIQTLEKALRIFPREPRIRKILAGQYYNAGDYIKASDLYSRLVQNDSTDVASWLRLAELASFTQQYNEAIPILELVLLLDSTNLNSLMMLGEILSRQNSSGAIIFYEKAYGIYPDNQKVAYAVGNWYIQSKMPDKAIPLCERVLEQDSTNIKFQKLLGLSAYKSGDPATAIKHLNRAVALGDSTAFTFKYLGISQYLTIAMEGAIASLKMAVEKDTMDAESHFFLGASLATTTLKHEAMFHLDKSLELMKPDPSVVSRIYSEQGNIMRLEMKYEKAYELYTLAWETDTTNLMSLYLMASILDNSMHRSKEALIDYQRYIHHVDLLPPSESRKSQIPSIRAIVEDRIDMLREELFFLDQK